MKPFVCGQGNAGWSTRLLCDQNWPITNASKGPPLAALAKWSQTSALIILRHCCSSLATTQTQRAQKGLCFTKLAAAFYVCQREWRTGSAQSRVRSSDRWTKIAGLASCTFKRRASSHVVPRYISVSFGEEQPLLQREVPLLQFWESLSGQNMFSGAVICILGAKKDCSGGCGRSGQDKLTAGRFVISL